MKRVCSIFAAAMFCLSFGVNSCTNEDPANPLEINLSRTATISGVLLLNRDLTVDADDRKWSAPDVTTDIFYVTVPYEELTGNSEAEGDYVVPKSNFKLNSSGEFEITVPVGAKATEVTVKINSFEGTVKKKVGADDKTVKVIWESREIIKKLTPGESYYKEELWNGAGTPLPYTEVTKSGDKP